MYALEVYFQCRESTGEGMIDLEEIFSKMEHDLKNQLLEAIEPLDAIQCARNLYDSVFAIVEEFFGDLLVRVRNLGTIRRRCETLTNPNEENTCWWQYRAQLVISLAETITDFQARFANFDNTALRLLEEYTVCRRTTVAELQ